MSQDIDAAEWLACHQRQLDADGIEVGVSREALTDVLSRLSAAEQRAINYRLEAHAQAERSYKLAELAVQQKDALENITARALKAESLLADALNSSETLERLAAVEHERWSGWILHQFKVGISQERKDRWVKLALTPYAELTEEVKEMDRVEVRKTLAALSRLTLSPSQPSGEKPRQAPSKSPQDAPGSTIGSQPGAGQGKP